MDGNLWGTGRAPPKPDVPSLSHDEGKVSKRPASEGEAHVPPSQRESPWEQPPLEPDLGEITELQGSSTPRSEWIQSQKRCLEDRSPHPSPSRKWATREEEKSMPRREAALPTGMTEEDLLPKRYEYLHYGPQLGPVGEG